MSGDVCLSQLDVCVLGRCYWHPGAGGGDAGLLLNILQLTGHPHPTTKDEIAQKVKSGSAEKSLTQWRSSRRWLPCPIGF